MSNIAIKVENLSKAYQLGQIGTGTISRDLERWYARIRGKEDPFLRIGESNNQSTKSESDIVWSLKDINFEIEQGDAVGIIGRNGAGKSTLLKILSKVTAPTTGKISGKGRIASLLEVGTGFHPELSGRENIFLNGAILGMRKKEIQRKLEEIVDFAGIERYLDTPVKRYSSGMYVRLAFAVAAHLESEILIVDEVLAVGDAEFQKKCLGKMGEVSKGEGRTVLFVSHNMTSIKDLCPKSILLNYGKIQTIGGSQTTINNYVKGKINDKDVWERNSPYHQIASFLKVWVEDQSETLKNVLVAEMNNYLHIQLDIKIPEEIKTMAFEIKTMDNTSILCSHDIDFSAKKYTKGLNHFKIKLPNFLKAGDYSITLGSNGNGFSTIEYFSEILYFEIISSQMQFAQRPGLIAPKLSWIDVYN
jgi:lipopolysaccharide transport system ATP-binding protein